MALAVIALGIDFQKAFLKMELPGAWLLPRIVKGTINPRRGMAVSNTCDASEPVGGQFLENVLGFRLPSSAEISIALGM